MAIGYAKLRLEKPAVMELQTIRMQSNSKESFLITDDHVVLVRCNNVLALLYIDTIPSLLF